MKKSYKFIFAWALLLLFYSGAALAQSYEYDTLAARFAQMTRVERGKPAPELNAEVKNLLLAQKSDGSWPDIDYTAGQAESYPAMIHIENRLARLALAYTSTNPLGEYNQNPALRDALIKGFHYWLSVKPKPLKAVTWYYTQVRIPLAYGKLLCIMKTGPGMNLPDSLVQRAVTVIKTVVNPDSHIGQNLSNILTHNVMGAAVTADSVWMKASLSKTVRIIPYVKKSSAGVYTRGDGLQVDHSYIFHEQHNLVLTYGHGVFTDIYNFATALTGTSFLASLPAGFIDRVGKAVTEGYIPTIWGNRLTLAPRGRAVAGSGKAGASFLPTAMKVDPANSEVFQAAIDRIEGRQSASYKIGPRFTNYWCADYAVKTDPRYYFLISAVSNRTRRPEGNIKTGTGENMLGKFLIDGFVQMMRTGAEYDNVQVAWEWDKVPGITCRDFASDADCRITTSYPQPTGTTEFVGGLSDGGANGIKSYTLNFNGVTAKKSWFVFDDEVVCLGAGINSVAAEKVVTSVNQVKRNGELSVKSGNVISTISDSTVTTFDNNLRWIYHDGIGYIFPSGGKAVIRNQVQTGRGTRIQNLNPNDTALIARPMFNVWLDHGAQPANGSYSYIMVPTVNSKQELDAYDAGKIKILSNTPSVQAVKHEGLNQLQIIFYSPGELTDTTSDLTIRARQACVLLVKNVGASKIDMYISDPTQRLLKAGIDVRFSAEAGFYSQTVTLPSVDYAGSTKLVSFDSKNAPAITNLALNKTATQSTTAYNAPASRAVDGNTNGAWSSGTVTHTAENESTPSWWQVDLGAAAQIETIEVFNRTDACCSGRLSNYEVMVSEVPFDQAVATDISSFSQTSQAGSPTKIKIEKIGRYVRIRLIKPNLALSLAEVGVYGYYQSTPSGARMAAPEQVAFENPSSGQATDALIVSPNPVITSGKLVISARPQDGHVSSEIRELLMLNRNGIRLRSWTFDPGTKEASVEVGKLAPGVYVLRIFDGKTWQSRNIVVSQ